MEVAKSGTDAAESQSSHGCAIRTLSLGGLHMGDSMARFVGLDVSDLSCVPALASFGTPGASTNQARSANRTGRTEAVLRGYA